MSSPEIYTIDLNFQGTPGIIGAYLIPHRRGAILVECGPGSTVQTLLKGLKSHGLGIADLTDVFLTHIHLDHAGAAGWLANQGVCIHVHPNGAPHLLNPEKLIASAARIYGSLMQGLWGELLPVPTERLAVIQDDQLVEVDNLQIRAINTPGHAEHHYAYLIDDICFSGDIGGIRLAGLNHLRLPMPPPEFHLEKWRESLERLRQEHFNRIVPTHFGIFSDPEWHLAALDNALDEVEKWMEAVMTSNPPIELLRQQFIDWTRDRSLESGWDASWHPLYEIANPSFMSADGILRYWSKYRNV